MNGIRNRFFINLTLYALGSLLFSFLMIKLPVIAILFTFFICIAFIFFADHSYQWTLFMYAKRYSVMIPIFLYALINWLMLNSILQNPKWLYFFIVILALNTLEAGILEVVQKDYGNRINGLMIIIFAILTPLHWSTKYNIIGFENIIWVLGYTSTLCYMFLKTTWFHEREISYTNIVILFVALIGVFINGYKWQFWMAYRAYSLYFEILHFSFFDRYRAPFYYDFSKSSWLIYMKQYHWIWLLLNFTLLVLLIISNVF